MIAWPRNVSIPVRYCDPEMSMVDPGESIDPDGDYMKLEVACPLPDRCTRHGRPADERRPLEIQFRPGLFGPEQASLRFVVLSLRRTGCGVRGRHPVQRGLSD